jgi:hypothetical protein
MICDEFEDMCTKERIFLIKKIELYTYNLKYYNII